VFVSVTVTYDEFVVPATGLFQRIEIAFVPAPPAIVPLEKLQLYVLPATAGVLYVAVD